MDEMTASRGVWAAGAPASLRAGTYSEERKDLSYPEKLREENSVCSQLSLHDE